LETTTLVDFVSYKKKTCNLVDFVLLIIFRSYHFFHLKQTCSIICLYMFQVEGRASVPTRQGPLVSNEKNSPVEKEKSSTRMSATVSGLSEDKLRGLSTGGEGWEKKMKRKRSVGTMLGRGSDVDRDVKSVGQHRPANEVRPRSSDGLAYR
jgi:hypothetical protein